MVKKLKAMAAKQSAGSAGLCRRRIRGAVVHDDDLAPWRRITQAADDAGNRQRFVFGGDDDRDSGGISQVDFFAPFALFASFAITSQNGS